MHTDTDLNVHTIQVNMFTYTYIFSVPDALMNMLIELQCVKNTYFLFIFFVLCLIFLINRFLTISPISVNDLFGGYESSMDIVNESNSRLIKNKH